jgi:hypothetical protein
MRTIRLDHAWAHGLPLPLRLALTMLAGRTCAGRVEVRRKAAGSTLRTMLTVVALALLAIGAPSALAVEPVRPITHDEVFAGAQALYPSLFPGSPVSFPYTDGGRTYDVRVYANGNHLGIADGMAYGLGPFTGQQLTHYGSVQTLACSLKPALCPTAGGVADGAVTLSSPDGGTAVPRVMIDTAGHATAVWLQLESSGSFRRSVWASRRPAGGAWSLPVRLESSESDIAEFDLGLDAFSGRAMVVWHETEGSHHDVWARPMAADGSWGSAEVIDTQDRNVSAVRVALDAQGRAVAVWNQLEPVGSWSVWANRHVPGSGWGAATRVAPAGMTDTLPRLAVAANGDAFVVWERAGAGVWVNRSPGGAAWGTPTQLVDKQTAVVNTQARVLADAQGRATVVWSRVAPIGGRSTAQVWARRFDGAWAAEAAVAAEVTGTVAAEPRLAINEDGVLAVTWATIDGAVWVNQAEPGQAWRLATPVRPPGGGSVTAVPDVAIDLARRVTLVWAARNLVTGRDEVLWDRALPGHGFSGGTPLQSGSAPGAEPRLASNTAGAVQVVWTEAQAGSVIVSRGFVPALP